MNKTFKRIQVKNFWPGMKGQIFNYIGTCEACHRMKAHRKKILGFFSMLTKPKPCERLELNFINSLPNVTDGNEYIMTCGDYLT